MILGT